ncbi:MAG: T9SS type B sorting domain-containing protein, partial [Flavobacteriaceae bacterium]
MKKGLLLVLLMIFCTHVSAQRSCGTEDYMNEMMKDPMYAKQWAKDQELLQKELARRSVLGRSSFAMNEIVIPVAVHFPEGSEADRACLEALAQNQIDILNGDFTATNPDANLWTAASAFYPGVVHGAANIKFCIATSNHPANTDNDLVEGGPAVSIGYDFGGGSSADPLWGGYLNFLVKTLGGGTLGFSPKPGNIAAGQAVSINTFAFGSGSGCPGSNVVPGAPYNLGRTVTHELGHFFDLSHVWGDGGCGVDDGIADTPEADGANGGCPSNPQNFPGCVPGEFELYMNYMDYTDDACMYMFSQGQIDVVDAYVSGVLEAQFKPNTVPVCVDTPEYTMTDGLINTCNGIFYDSGGADVVYANNETFTYTICPENPGQIIQLDFTSFSTQAGVDILSIYNADNADDPTTLLGEYSGTDSADSPGTVAATTTNTSGCLTFVFTSNAFGVSDGWQANISCQDPPTECQTILAQLDSAFPEPNADGYILVCPGEEITLTGSGTFSEPGGGDGATYQWETGDGTVIDGQTATFSYDTPGVYVANLNIWDTNTTILPEGCKNTNLINQIILVSTTPDFTATVPDQDPLCFGATTSIAPVVTPTTFNNDCTPPESVQTFLPDGNGDRYTTCITVSCYQSDQVIEDISDLVDICLNIEHSYVGDLEIFITSPNGVQVALHNYYGIGNSQYLGGANDDGTTQPGVGADYCFSMAGTDNLINGNLISAGSPAGPSIEPGLYLPDESFENLIGSSLNGDWCIEVVDNLSVDNGYIFSWELNFDPALTPANLSFTPEIVSGSWADDPTITETNADVITIAPPTEGQYCYTYTVVDNFGCEYAHEVCVDVLPELIFNAPDDLLICDPAAAPYIFDLSQNETTMLAPTPNPADYVVTFHNTIADAENDTGAITDTTAYSGTDNEEIFVRFEYLDSNCFEIETFQLKLIDLPQIFAAPDLVLCDDLSNDGVEEFDLEQQTLTILGAQSATDYDVSYHVDFASAEAGTGNLSSPYLSTSDAQGIYVRVQSAGGGGCFIVSPNPLFNLIVTNKATATAPSDMVLCDDGSGGYSSFDLESQTTTILGTQDPATFTVTYHATPADADNNTAALTSPFTNTVAYGQPIYVRVEEAGLPNCYETTEFELLIDPLPTTTTMTPLSECDDDADGVTQFMLTDKDTEALGGQTGVTVSYHATQSDAENNTAALISPYSNTVDDLQQIFIRLTGDTNCYSTMPLDLVVDPLPVPELATLPSQCDDDTDGLQTFDMSGVAAQVIGAQTDMVVSYHLTRADAEGNTGALGNSITTTTPDIQTIYIRLENTLTNCYAISTIDLVVDPLPIIAPLTPFVLCDDTNAGNLEEEFDLSTKDLEIINGQDASVSYHATATDAQNNTAPLPTLYTSGSQTIFVGLEDNTTGCRSVAELELTVDPLPTTTTMTPLSECDDDADGVTQFMLTDKDTEALGGQTGVTVSYHATQSDAENNTAALISPYSNTVDDLQQIFIRLTGDTNCYSTMPLDLVVDPLPVPELATLPSQCDDDTDGLQTFDMSGVAAQVIGAQTDMVVSYHLTRADAEGNTGALGNSITTTTPDIQTIYIRLENTLTNCYAISTIDLVVDPLPVVDLEDNYVICADATGGGLDFVVVDPGLSPATYNFTWRDEFGVVLSSDPTYTIDEGGIYSLEVSYASSTGCSSPLEIFTVSESGSPAVTVDVLTEDFADTHVVLATATGTGIYEFSFDQGPWLDSGTFIGVDPGEHTVYIRDVNGCGITAVDVYIVDYPKYFTPNGDGYHDTWNIDALSGQLGSRIYIFDRYGKLLKQISPAGDGWDGTYNGQPMP